MDTLNTLALIAHVLIAAAIIGLVMLQKGKGADAGAGFCPLTFLHQYRVAV